MASAKKKIAQSAKTSATNEFFPKLLTGEHKKLKYCSHRHRYQAEYYPHQECFQVYGPALPV